MSLRLVVLYGSVRSERQGIRGRALHRGRVPGARTRGRRSSIRWNIRCRCSTGCTRNTRRARPPRRWSASPAHRVGRRVHRRVGRVQPLHPSGALEPARPLPRGVLLEAFGDRLLLGRLVRRRPGGHAVARDARRDGHVEHPVDLAVPKVQDAFDEHGKPRPDDAPARREVPRRARVVRPRAPRCARQAARPKRVRRAELVGKAPR